MKLHSLLMAMVLALSLLATEPAEARIDMCRDSAGVIHDTNSRSRDTAARSAGNGLLPAVPKRVELI